ncbi:MAG: electron transport complex subunit RsxE, partial [Providencia sp.]|nr:electron transport complex subunit RsxE [Providencia sp.]
SWATSLRIEVIHLDSPFLLAMLPPGAFIGLALLLAAKYLIDEKMKKRAALRADHQPVREYEKQQGCGGHLS